MFNRVGNDMSIHYNAQIFVASVFNFPHVKLRCHENTQTAKFMGPTWGPPGPRWVPCWPHEPRYQGMTRFANGPAGISKIHARPFGEMGHIFVALYIMVEWYAFPNKYTASSYKQNEYNSNIISPVENMNNDKCGVVISAAICINVIYELKGV